jgi:pyruvate formate lyase activating enzyme
MSNDEDQSGGIGRGRSRQRSKALYYTTRDDQCICTLCPHGCRIADGETGICGIRTNSGGRLTLPHFGMASALNIDPIEKKPLYHFHPGSAIYSIGFLGCNFRCPFCQNYSISQSTSHSARYVSPAELVASARDAASRSNDVVGIAYTYNEPSIHIEYILEAASLAHESGLVNVLVTNGYLLPGPARDLLLLMDAANVDLKSMNNDFYENVIGGSLPAVKHFLEIAAELTHLEVTTLLIPGKNDSKEEVLATADFVAGLGSSVPLHLSAYYPAYRYDAPATRPEDLLRAVETAGEVLPYVYPGNVRSTVDTYCAACGATLVSRHGYTVDRSGLVAGTCARCGASVPIVDA